MLAGTILEHEKLAHEFLAITRLSPARRHSRYSVHVREHG